MTNDDMHVSILGAGALGRAYAAALWRAKCRVTLITRAGEHERNRFACKRHGALPRRDDVEVRSSSCIPECDVILVTVRAENVNGSLVERLRSHTGPIVVLTPMLAHGTAELWSTLPRSVAAMPNVLASWDDGLLDWWAPPLTRTLLDAASKNDPLVAEFARSVQRGGIGVRFVENVAAISRATTIAFMPLQLAAVAQPDVTRWHENPTFVRRVALALRHCRRLALAVAAPELGIRIGTWVLSLPLALSLFSRVAVRAWPPAARYLSSHFGEKLKDQTVRFASELGQLSADAGLSPHEAEELSRLLPPSPTTYD